MIPSRRADTIPGLLYDAASRFPERQAVVFPGLDSYSYAGLADRCDRIATWLAARGVGQGDRIMVRADNGIVMFDAFLAATRLGAACVPVGSGLAQPEVDFMVGDAQPVLGLADASGAGSLVSAGLEVLVGETPEYQQALASQPDLPPGPDPSDTALIIYTSGTTGRPKGVCLSHDAITYNAATAALSQEFGDHEIYLSSTPLYHASAGLRVFTMLDGGHTHIVLPKFDPGVWLEVVEQEKVTATIAVPTQITSILDYPTFAPERLSSMRLLVYGAAPSTGTQMFRMRTELPCGLYHGYGLTEACTVVTAFTADDHRALTGPEDPRLGSCGRPIAGVEVVVRREDGSPVEPGKVGEITVRSPKVMSGYWQDKAATAEVFREGWLHTGDLAVVDTDGFLTIVGRSKEIIISGGVNIFPAQVERAIASHPDVVEVAVFGVPDQVWGESPAAAVRVHPGSDLDADTVIGLVADSLDRRARPRQVVFVTDFPRTATGKIRKSDLVSLIPPSLAR